MREKYIIVIKCYKLDLINILVYHQLNTKKNRD